MEEEANEAAGCGGLGLGALAHIHPILDGILAR